MENDSLDEMQANTGFVSAQPLPSSFIAGGETGIASGVKVPSRDWTHFLPTPEKQNRIYTYANLIYNFDVLACVTFSALNNIEIMIKQMVASGELAPDKVQQLRDMGFFDEQGNFNASDRFTAKMSGTSKNGNTLEAVANSIRHHGILPESDWQFVFSQADQPTNWAAYYAEIPQELKDKAKKVLDILDFRYEWVVIDGITKDPISAIKNQLLYSPMQIAAPVCSPWNTSEIINRCDVIQAGHATTIYGFEEGKFFRDFDHYTEFYKKLAWNYYIPYAFRYSVSPTVPAQPVPPFSHNFSVNLRYGVTNPEVKALQDALKIDGVMSSIVISTGYFGTITLKAVKDFQLKYGITTADSAGYGLVGPLTRGKLNQLFNS